ncbi:BQ2448_5855 [Microbotryum intermedium]|uniref:BQ2448_5855 protein n=1 Tax=Microbotryum intermedium TaxID=269621 RepID=A0A238F3A3_9BASI|nr:BQ2448_5855 [Microbotryum intermedium]
MTNSKRARGDPTPDRPRQRPWKPLTKHAGRFRLESLPLELLQLASQPRLAGCSGSGPPIESSTREWLLDPESLSLWTRAREAEHMPRLDCWDLTTSIGEVRLANLAFGRTCRGCGKGNACKVDYFLRAREGPDEPDPAFAQYFLGTKRYTPRSRTGKKWKSIRTFFFMPALEATSEWLTTLFEHVLDEAKSQYLEPEEVEDLFDRPTEQIQRRLDERQRWVDAVLRVSTWFLSFPSCLGAIPDSEGVNGSVAHTSYMKSSRRATQLEKARYTLDRHPKKLPCLRVRQSPSSKIMRARELRTRLFSL